MGVGSRIDHINLLGYFSFNNETLEVNRAYPTVINTWNGPTRPKMREKDGTIGQDKVHYLFANCHVIET